MLRGKGAGLTTMTSEGLTTVEGIKTGRTNAICGERYLIYQQINHISIYKNRQMGIIHIAGSLA